MLRLPAVSERIFLTRTRTIARPVLSAAFALAIILCAFAAAQDKADSPDKNLDIKSSVGDLHLGNDGNARKAGLPLYPGARIKQDDENKNAVNLGVLTEAFGMKLVVASYESDDAPAKVLDFYRDKLKKYGKVLECHTHEHGGNVHADIDDRDDDDDKDNSSKDRQLKCDGDNSGPVTELKVGTKDNQHVVAVEPPAAGAKTKTTFALVYVHTRGKEGDI